MHVDAADAAAAAAASDAAAAAAVGGNGRGWHGERLARLARGARGPQHQNPHAQQPALRCGAAASPPRKGARQIWPPGAQPSQRPGAPARRQDGRAV